MTDMTLVLRLKADGTAEVVGAAKQVATAVAGVGVATDEAALAQARLARLVSETATPVERLQARLAELATLAPFASTAEQAKALVRATAELDQAVASYCDDVRTTSAAQERLANLVAATRTPVERLQATLSDLERLRPFARSSEEADALARAVTAAEAALNSHSAAAQEAAVAQARLAGLIDETRTPVERLQARLVELAALKPFAATEAEADALARTITSTEAALASYDAEATKAIAAQERLARLIDDTATPVQRLQARLAELEALRPFAHTTAEAQSLASAIRATEAEITAHSANTLKAAAAQAQLTQIVERTPAEIKRLGVELRELEALRPFAQTGEEIIALERNLARARAALQVAAQAQDNLGRSGGLAAHQIQNLQYQFSDVVAQLGSGTNPFTIMMQQGPQVVDALGGITSAAGLVTVGVLALGAVTVAPFAMLTARAMAADAHIRSVSVALQATGRASQAVAADIEALTDRTAQSPFFNRDQAEQAIQGLARMRQVSAQLREQILALAPAFAAATGKDAAAAALELGDAFSHPTEGAKKLDDALGNLGAGQLESIERFDRRGGRLAAQQALYDALLPRLRGLADQGMTPTARAAKELGDAWDDLMTSISRSEAIQATVRGLTNLVNAMRDLAAWDTPVARSLQFAQTRLQEETGKLSGWEQKGLTAGDRWSEGAFLKSDGDILDAQRQKVAKLKDEVEALRQKYADLQQATNLPSSGASAAAGGGTGSASPPAAANADQIKQALAASRELLQVEEQRQALLDKERLLQTALNGTKDVEQRRQLGRAILEVRSAYAALLTPQEQALKASGEELRVAEAGRLGRVKLAATIQAENEARDRHLVGKARETFITDKVNAAVHMAAEGYSENIKVMDATARGALTLAEAYGAGEAAALRQAAANDASVQALTVYGVSVDELTQSLLEQRAAEAAAAFAGQTLQYQRQVTGLKAVAAAQRESVAAVQDAQREAKLAEMSESLRAKAAATGNADIIASVDALIERYRALSKEEQDATRDGALNEMIRQQRDGVALATAELRLVGATDEQRRLELARLKAINDLKAKGIDLEKETDAQRKINAQTYIDEAVAAERVNIKLDREKEAAAERVRIATKATDDVVEYGAQAIDDMLAGAKKGWRGLWDSVTAMARRTLATIAAEAILRPIVAPIIFSALGAAMPATAATPQGVAGVLTGQSGGAAGGVSSLTNTALSKAGGWALDKLAPGGLTSGLDAWGYSTLGVGSASYGTPLVATNGMLTGGGATSLATPTGVTGGLSGYLGAAGAGAFGGMLGGMIGTATNSKVVGGLSGAALGAGGSALAAAMGLGAVGGPIGIAIGAIVGGIMGALGTQKKSVGPNGAGNLYIASSGLKSGPADGDNGMDGSAMLSVSDAVSQSINTIVSGIGAKFAKTTEGAFAHFTMFQEGNKWAFSDQAGGGRQEFTSQEAFVNGLIKTSLQRLDGDGRISGVNADTRAALANSKATKAEDLANDLSFAAGFRKQLDALNASLNPVSNQIKTMTDAAKALGEQAKTSITDWLDKAAELGLATAAELTAAARRGIEALMGLGPAVEPLTGLSAVTKQAEINFEALRPSLAALGYSAAEVADLSARYTQKMEADYTASVRLLQRQGASTLSALVDPSAKLSLADRFQSGLGLDPAASGVAALIAQFQAVETAAGTGALTFGQLQAALGKLDAAAMAGIVSGDQYTSLVGSLTAAWQTATGVLTAQRQGLTAIETAMDASWRANLDGRLSDAGLSGGAIEALRSSFQPVLDAAKTGSTSAAQMRDALSALDAQLRAGAVTAEQHRAAVSVLTSAWSDSATVAQASATAAAQAAQTASDAFAKAAQTASDAFAKATQSASDQLEQARRTRDSNAELHARGLTVMGDAAGAALLRADLTAAQERERSANDNVALLSLVQVAERANAIATALRQDLVTAIDRQSAALNENTAGLQASAQKWGQLTGLSAAASGSLTGSASYLAPWERLTTARTQFDGALATWNSSKSDDERFAAAAQLQTLGQALKEAASGWFGGTDNTDAARVNAVWTEIGDNAQRQVSAAQAQIAVNERQLKALEAARISAEALGTRQVGGLDTLTAQTSAAFATLTAAVNAVSAAMSATTPNATGATTTTNLTAPILSAEQKYLRDNPDVAADPYFGSHPAEHYALTGAAEGRARDGLLLTRDQEYLARYADVAAAVRRGEFTSGEDHYNRYGRFEGRAFANGGVMTPWGELSLAQRPAGGVATAPTLTVYGEGDRPEAFVPLPDGRSIPVTVSMPRPTAPALSSGGVDLGRLAALLARGNDLAGDALDEMRRNTRVTAAGAAESVTEARRARALASRQAAVAERLGRAA